MPLLSRNRIIVMAGLIAASALAYAHLIEPKRLVVRHVAVRLPNLPPAFYGYRIVHVSDLHMGSWMTRPQLHRAVKWINILRPDLIAITGDFIDRIAGEASEDLIEPLSQLQPRDATVAVMGNHDYYHGVNGVRRVLRATGMIDVSNRVHTVRRGEASLHLTGVDDVAQGHDCLDAVLDQLPDDGTAILLVHEPDFAHLSAPTGRFALQLSGHTHGGQVRLPIIGTPVLPSYGLHFVSGLNRAGDMQVYVNAGIGMIPPFVRFGVRPEITVLTLMHC
ncbi:MAG: serine/threonine protein phosphatase [Anaerolineaceae bacterium]|nr:serine/threonine protein phosphatase [Anaerolineaceae bacterium]